MVANPNSHPSSEPATATAMAIPTEGPSTKPTSTPAPTPTPNKPLTLSILSEVTTAQSTHGLKHSDYDRYRQYCTRRISRIRQATTTTQRYGGQQRRYIAETITHEDVLRNDRVLTIPLVLAERDWAFAMHTKREQPGGPNRSRRRVLARLTRAVAHANALSALCRSAGDEHTVLEAEAYAKSMQAALALEREAWTTALQAFEVVQKIYTGMAGVRTGTSTAALYERKIEEVAQAMRYCKYNLAKSDDADRSHLLAELRSDAADVSSDAIGEKIEAALSEARRQAAVQFGNVVWCGVEVALRSERVREVVLTTEEESSAFSDGHHVIDDYDKLFVVFNDALTVVTDELRQFRSSAGNNDDRVRELELLMAYLTYKRLQHTIARNLLLVESSKTRRSSKPEDFVRLYDNLIANMNDVLALRGVDEDAAIYNDATARRGLFQAYRCYFLAQCYQIAGLQNEAAALFDRVAVHAKSLGGAYGEEARKVVLESAGMKYRARAVAYLKELEATNGVDNLSLGGDEIVRKRMMVDHLDEVLSFVSSEGVGKDSSAGGFAICDMPPALEAVPCKPVLFDLAVDGVRLPDEEESEEHTDEKEEQVDKASETKEATSTSSFAGISATRLGRWWSGSSS